MLGVENGGQSWVTALVAGQKVKGGTVAGVQVGVLPKERSHHCPGYPELFMGLSIVDLDCISLNSMF